MKEASRGVAQDKQDALGAPGPVSPGTSGRKEKDTFRVAPTQGMRRLELLLPAPSSHRLSSHQRNSLPGTSGLSLKASKGSGGSLNKGGLWENIPPTCANILCWKLITSDYLDEFNLPLSKV